MDWLGPTRLDLALKTCRGQVKNAAPINATVRLTAKFADRPQRDRKVALHANNTVENRAKAELACIGSYQACSEEWRRRVTCQG